VVDRSGRIPLRARPRPGPAWLSAIPLLVVGSALLLVLGAYGQSRPVTAPHRYSTAWKVRRPIVVQNSAGQSLRNYQVKVSLPSAFDFSKTASTGNDIRFTDSDGATALDYWKEAFDPIRQTGVFWVKVPTIPARSSKKIYIYYGDPAATSQSNGHATFPFFDDFTRSAWTSLPNMPTPAADASAAVVNGKFYIMGGYDDTPGDALSTNFEFDPRTGTYSPRSPMPTPRWGAIAVGVGTKVYVFGGGLFSETTPARMTEVYDTRADSWTTRGPAPASIAKEGITGCTDGVHVFLFAGGAGYSYDVRTNRYSALAAMPHYVSNWATCGYYKGKVFLVGGFSNDREVDRTTQIYDVNTNHWSTGRPMPIATYGSVRENPIVGNEMYILQGQHVGGEFSSKASAYDLSSNTWSDRSLGPHAEDGVAGGVYNGKIFTFGGRQDLSGPYGLNYASVYDPSADRASEWRQVTGGFEMSGGGLRRMVPPRGSDDSSDPRGQRFSQLVTQNFQTAGDFMVEARTRQGAVPTTAGVPTTSWNSIGVETSLGDNGSGVRGCQIPLSATTSTLPRTTTERASALTTLAPVSPATTDVVTYGVARSKGNLLVTENGRPVLQATDRSCRSGKDFVSIQTTGENAPSWSQLFVRAYSVIEPKAYLR
jgi:hypothetical protein